MKALLVVLVLLLAGVAGLGFYRGWFSFASDSAGARSNVTHTVAQDKFQEDRKVATESVQGLGRQAKDKAAGPAEKVADGSVVRVKGGALTIINREGKEHRHTPAASPLVEGAPMRFVYLLILLLALAAVVVFAAQNNDAVTLQFLDRSVTCALPLLVAVVYLFGIVSGGTVIGLLRRSLHRATERRED